MSSCTVIIPVFGHAALTDQCLQVLLDHGSPRIVVVDDGSTDETRRVLHRYGGRIQVVTHQENRGFAVSCNDGAAVAQGDNLVFLNNDTQPQKGWLTALEAYADKHPEAAVVGSKLLYPDGTVQHAGVVICQDRYPRHIYTGFPADHAAVNKCRRFQIVTAASMLIRRRVFEEVGGFDPAFRNGFEDVDLCLRLGHLGREIHYCPLSIVTHLESVSSGRFRHDRDNVTVYRERWLRRVRPDDLQYYLEDDLLHLSYEGRFPFNLDVSPLLATLDGNVRGIQVERLLRERNRQLAELSRENTRLRLELGARGEDSALLSYARLRRQAIDFVQKAVPVGAKILVISKGDGSLLDFPDQEGWHFPQTERGAYAGCHPADSAEAVTHLENLRARGADYLLIPGASLWWLDHYAEFREHLETHYARLPAPENLCALFELSPLQAKSGRYGHHREPLDQSGTGLPRTIPIPAELDRNGA